MSKTLPTNIDAYSSTLRLNSFKRQSFPETQNRAIFHPRKIFYTRRKKNTPNETRCKNAMKFELQEAKWNGDRSGNSEQCADDADEARASRCASAGRCARDTSERESTKAQGRRCQQQQYSNEYVQFEISTSVVPVD